MPPGGVQRYALNAIPQRYSRKSVPLTKIQMARRIFGNKRNERGTQFKQSLRINCLRALTVARASSHPPVPPLPLKRYKIQYLNGQISNGRVCDRLWNNCKSNSNPCDKIGQYKGSFVVLQPGDARKDLANYPWETPLCRMAVDSEWPNTLVRSINLNIICRSLTTYESADTHLFDETSGVRTCSLAM